MGAARIAKRFAALAAEGRAGLITYVMAGDPDAAASARILAALPAAGADLIEVGLPFSDPMADGPSIQKAANRALAAGMTLKGTLALVGDFRARDQATPVILMGYLNPLLSHGLEAFAADADRAGVDGVIVVDCPPEEAGPLASALEAAGLALIRLTTPTTDAERMKVVTASTHGFVYHVAVAGVTGAAGADPADLVGAVNRARAASGLPVAVGFGIRTPDQAAGVARIADAAVVGSALVEVVGEACALNRDPAAEVVDSVAALAKAVRSARARAA